MFHDMRRAPNNDFLCRAGKILFDNNILSHSGVMYMAMCVKAEIVTMQVTVHVRHKCRTE